MFTSALFTMASIWKQPTCLSVDKYMKNSYYIYAMKCHSAIKKIILPFVTACMDLEGIVLSEISQTEKDKYRMISLIYGI